MTTPIHNCDQTWYQYSLESWIRNGLLNEVEVRELCVASNTLFTIPTGPYMGRAKAPNIAIRQRNARLPSVVFESGWSESITQLHNDMREWITWGNGLVKVVVILNWTRIGNNRVRGLAEVWFRNNSGNGQLLERHQIFPKPGNGNTQMIRALTRRTVFGNMLLPSDRGPDEYLPLSINRLREAAEREMWLMNLVPA